MANKLTVSGAKPTVSSTADIPARHLFTDDDGDLHIKAAGAGFIRLTSGGDGAAALYDEDYSIHAPYTDLGPLLIER